jgi:CHAD domain-containing protein
MPHRIGKHEDIGEGLFRLVGEDLAEIRQGFTSNGPEEERVHRARQRLKRLRTLTRVFRPVLGEHGEPLKAALREISHLLAGARDADAAVETARALREAAANRPGHGFDGVVAELAREAKATHAASLPVDNVLRRLGEIEGHFAAIGPVEDGAALLTQALARAYRRGRRARSRALESLATPDLHLWRKSAKDLWHLLRLCRKRLPRRAETLTGRLERLADLLGRDHDYALLAERLALAPQHDPALGLQLSVIAGERRKLEAEAIALGDEIYRDKPKEFARRMRLG